MQTLTHRILPGLGTTVSTIGAGCWALGGPATNHGVPIGWDGIDDDSAYRALVTAHELGITLYDTADVYGLGRSERLLGRLLTEVSRDDLVICSKAGYFTGTGSHPYQPRQLRHQLATSLDNLNTDHLDIYQAHSTDFGPDDRYLASTAELLDEFRAQGAVRAVAMRAPHEFAEHWTHEPGQRGAATRRWLTLFDKIRPTVLTVRYNMLSPIHTDSEIDIFAFARRHQVGVLIKQALGQGLLVQNLDAAARRMFSAGDHRSADPWFSPSNIQQLKQRLAPLRAQFGHTTSDMARIAVRYALHHEPDAAVLIGFRNAAHITTVIQSLGDPLTNTEIADIRAALHPTTHRRA